MTKYVFVRNIYLLIGYQILNKYISFKQISNVVLKYRQY